VVDRVSVDARPDVDGPPESAAAAGPGQISAAAEPGPALAHLRRELARGTAELAVLSVLDSGRRYGYELLKLLRQAGDGVLEVREGTLYPLLHRLEDTGLIAATWDVEGRARPRKYYTITADGRSRLTVLRAEWTGLVDAMRRLFDALSEVPE
jgi:PadR family transcriptional regulator PadR